MKEVLVEGVMEVDGILNINYDFGHFLLMRLPWWERK